LRNRLHVNGQPPPPGSGLNAPPVNNGPSYTNSNGHHDLSGDEHGSSLPAPCPLRPQHPYGVPVTSNNGPIYPNKPLPPNPGNTSAPMNTSANPNSSGHNPTSHNDSNNHSNNNNNNSYYVNQHFPKGEFRVIYILS